MEFVEPPANMVRFENTPPRTGKSVVARFKGTGTKRILLLAHMDTVYLRGMLAKQPFRIDGDRAYGLGIDDDKHGRGADSARRRRAERAERRATTACSPC